MKSNIATLIVFSVVGLFVLALAGQTYSQDAEAGKKVFTDSKCNMCHSVESAAITKATPGGKVVDLSNTGANHTAEWFEKYLKKLETVNEKKHMKEFTGKEEDLKALSQWLASLKKAAK